MRRDAPRPPAAPPLAATTMDGGHAMEVDELLPISGLQHLIFCERQFALIHVEQLWAENELTISGRQLHERADIPGHSLGVTVRVARALPLRSERLGLAGKADVVE